MKRYWQMYVTGWVFCVAIVGAVEGAPTWLWVSMAIFLALFGMACANLAIKSMMKDFREADREFRDE